jgi:hypothetical protein
MKKKQITAEELERRKKQRKEKAAGKRNALKKTDMPTEVKGLLELLYDDVEEVAEAILEEYSETEILELISNLEEEIADKITDEVEEAVKGIRAEFNEKLLALKAQVKRAETVQSNGKKTVKDYFTEKAADFKDINYKNSGTVKLEVPLRRKDFMGLQGGNYMGTEHFPMPQVIPGINNIQYPQNKILDFITVVPIQNSTVSMINEVPDDNAGDFRLTNEGQTMPLVLFKFVTQEETAKKIAAHTKQSKEIIEDISFMSAETERLLSEKHDRKLAHEVLVGTGVGQMLGLNRRAAKYIQTCLNGRVESPELAEVLYASATQIRSLGYDGNLVAVVNPCDWAAEMMRKNDQKELLEMNKLLEGITVVQASDMHTGQYFIGDLSRVTFYNYKGLELSVGFVDKDFIEGLLTINAESRSILWLSTAHRGALVADTINTVKLLISK